MKQGRRVLIVEDDLAWQKRLQRHLERQGLTVDIAADLASSRHLLATRTYALVTVDINLVGSDPHNQDGLEVLALLNQRGITAIVIRSSGEDSQQASRQALEEKYKPFAYFLKYRYNANDFRAAVQRALSNHSETLDT